MIEHVQHIGLYQADRFLIGKGNPSQGLPFMHSQAMTRVVADQHHQLQSARLQDVVVLHFQSRR